MRRGSPERGGSNNPHAIVFAPQVDTFISSFCYLFQRHCEREWVKKKKPLLEAAWMEKLRTMEYCRLRQQQQQQQILCDPNPFSLLEAQATCSAAPQPEAQSANKVRFFKGGEFRRANWAAKRSCILYIYISTELEPVGDSSQTPTSSNPPYHSAENPVKALC